MGNPIVTFVEDGGSLKTKAGERIVKDSLDTEIKVAMLNDLCVGQLTTLLNSTKDPDLHQRLFRLSEELNQK
ncbi:MAG: hypothetical protein ACKKL6_01280 [Candidatus Komeilibacteria bacterium]